MRVADQRSTAPYQDCQARAEGGVQPLDESGVELGSALAFFQQPLSSFRTAMRYQGHYDDHPTNDAFGRMATRSLQQRPYHIFALVTCFFSAVNNDNVLTYFAPCRVGHIGAELLSRAHVAYAFQVVEPLECHKDLHFFNLHVLLECYHTHRRML